MSALARFRQKLFTNITTENFCEFLVNYFAGLNYKSLTRVFEAKFLVLTYMIFRSNFVTNRTNSRNVLRFWLWKMLQNVLYFFRNINKFCFLIAIGTFNLRNHLLTFSIRFNTTSAKYLVPT
jgi:hypothetical protein